MPRHLRLVWENPALHPRDLFDDWIGREVRELYREVPAEPLPRDILTLVERLEDMRPGARLRARHK